MCKGKQSIKHNHLRVPSTSVDNDSHNKKLIMFIALTPCHTYFGFSSRPSFEQLKKREKIPDMECLEQMEMIKNEIDLFLEHHQALCQQTSPSLLDYLRYVSRRTKLATN